LATLGCFKRVVDGCKEDKTDLKVLQGLMKKRDLVVLNKGDKTVIQKETWKKKDVGYRSAEEVIAYNEPIVKKKSKRKTLENSIQSKQDTRIEENK